MRWEEKRGWRSRLLVRWVLSAVRNCGGGGCFCCHTLASALFLYSNNCRKLKALVTPLIAMTLQFDPASCFAFNGSSQKAKLAAAAAARALRTTACDAPLLIATAPPSATATMAPVLVENREPSGEVRTHMQLRARGWWVSEASKNKRGGRGGAVHERSTPASTQDKRMPVRLPSDAEERGEESDGVETAYASMVLGEAAAAASCAGGSAVAWQCTSTKWRFLLPWPHLRRRRRETWLLLLRDASAITAGRMLASASCDRSASAAT